MTKPKHSVISEDITVYRVKFPDGQVSQALNKQRAFEFARRFNEGEINPKIGYSKILDKNRVKDPI